MADMMRMICFTITQSQQRAMQLSAAFRYAIFTPKQEELYVSALMQKGYFAEWNYVVVMMDICDRLDFKRPSGAFCTESGARDGAGKT